MSPIPEKGPIVNISVSTTLFHPRQPRKRREKILITHHITNRFEKPKHTPKTPKHQTALETTVGYSLIALAKGLALLHTVWQCEGSEAAPQYRLGVEGRV